MTHKPGRIPGPRPTSRADRFAAWQARWGINRASWRIEPGLYALRAPSADSSVFATANYKFSFDELRKNLKGLDAWLLVLDTNGINVWCAAGKGTFGTLELVRSIMGTGLEKQVNHKTVILPQLGAPGVAAHRVKAYTGFSVVYGPVRAEDIPEFLRRNGKANPEMRKVRFDFTDRVILAPIELVSFGNTCSRPPPSFIWPALKRTPLWFWRRCWPEPCWRRRSCPGCPGEASPSKARRRDWPQWRRSSPS